MPDRMHTLDTGYPNFSGMERTEDKVTAIQNYLFMLMEELRYLLRHLDAGNFTDAGLTELADSMVAAAEKTGDTAFLKSIDQALVAGLAGNADLLFDRLSTSRRIRKYLLGDLSDDNFVRVQDGYVRWITGSIIYATPLTAEDGTALLTESGRMLVEEGGNAYREQAVNRFGQALYWQREPKRITAEGWPLDAEGNPVFAAAEKTAWPVAVYRYLETVKAQLALTRTDGARPAELRLGTPDADGGGVGLLSREEDGLRIRYISSLQKNVDITFGNDGFVDADHRRLESCHIDRQNGRITYTVEGDEDLHQLGFTESSGRVEFTWPDGFRCEVEVT